MNQHKDSNTGSASVRKQGAGRRWMMAAALVAAVGAAGASFAGEGFGGHGGMHGGGRHHQMDPANAAKHIERMIERIAPDASAQQKTRLAEIAKSAFADLQPMHEQMRESHKRLHELLKQPVVDHAALEALRVEQVQRFDAVSKRLLTAVEEAAAILTPEQRARFAEHMQKRMH